MRRPQKTIRQKVLRIMNAVKATWPDRLSEAQLEQLKQLVEQHQLSPVEGDLQILSARWYVTHSGLLRLARRNRCSGIVTEIVQESCDKATNRWVVKATVFKTPKSKGFVGYGDADPSNVSPLVRGAEMRVAETRAVNRALRKAYGIGLCSVEEIGSFSGPLLPPAVTPNVAANTKSGNGHPVRDRLLLLIRQHQLDPAQVKRYATHFCGAATLREASREQVEQFVNHLAEAATHGREQLLEKLAPFAEARINNASNTACPGGTNTKEAA